MPVPSLTEHEIHQVLEPEFNSDTFVFGKNLDGSLRTWKLQPLPWKYEKNFRKQVMPMLAVTYKPFETIISSFSQNYLSQSVDVVGALFSAETDSDEYLSKSLHAILIAQDKTITLDQIDEWATSRDQIMDIVQRQCDLHKIMDRLGELLAERFEKLAHMMGVEIDLPSLKLLWKQASAVLSERIMKAASTVHNVTGPFTESSSEITSLPTPRQHLSPNVDNLDNQTQSGRNTNQSPQLRPQLIPPL